MVLLFRILLGAGIKYKEADMELTQRRDRNSTVRKILTGDSNQEGSEGSSPLSFLFNGCIFKSD